MDLWFVNVGEGEHSNWDDNRKYGYLGAGQGGWYSGALERLSLDDEVFAYMKGRGYVGYGKVTQEATMIRDFVVEEEDKPLLELPLRAPHPEENSEIQSCPNGLWGLNESRPILGTKRNLSKASLPTPISSVSCGVSRQSST